MTRITLLATPWTDKIMKNAFVVFGMQNYILLNFAFSLSYSSRIVIELNFTHLKHRPYIKWLGAYW